ncbi:hypothetical protein PFISCL1PPCAC_1861, partial [Pristionchus fissidentatus]
LLVRSGRIEWRMGRRRSISSSRSRSRSRTRSRSRSRSRSPRRRVKRERRSPVERKEDATYEYKSSGHPELPKDIELIEAFSDKNRGVKSVLKKFDWDYEDSDLWTETIKELEKQNAPPDVMRAAFAEVLDRWPYCYGYWSKWASLEAKTDSTKAIEVYESAVNAFPLSVEIWLAYIRYMRMELMKREDGLEGIQRLNARALVTVGREWKSIEVWKEVIAFEYSIGNTMAVTIVLDNLISTPLNGMADSWELMTKHFDSTPWSSLLPPNEKAEVESECVKEEEKIDEGICKLLALDRRHHVYDESRWKAKE